MDDHIPNDYDTDFLVWLKRQADDAVDGAATETGLPKAAFPQENPFTRQQIFDPDYLP